MDHEKLIKKIVDGEIKSELIQEDDGKVYLIITGTSIDFEFSSTCILKWKLRQGDTEIYNNHEVKSICAGDTLSLKLPVRLMFEIGSDELKKTLELHNCIGKRKEIVKIQTKDIIKPKRKFV
jgi:hypothetical protein